MAAVLLFLMSAATLHGQDADPLETGCVDSKALSESMEIVAGTPAPGTLGMAWGGSVEFRDGAANWSEHPTISAVVCDGPAHKAGLRPGDAILTVDGISARTNPFPGRIPGRRYTLEVRRGEDVLSVVLVAVARGALH